MSSQNMTQWDKVRPHLRLARQALFFDFGQLSKKTGISPVTLRAYEQGMLTPTDQHWKAICAVLKGLPTIWDA